MIYFKILLKKEYGKVVCQSGKSVKMEKDILKGTEFLCVSMPDFESKAVMLCAQRFSQIMEKRGTCSSLVAKQWEEGDGW